MSRLYINHSSDLTEHGHRASKMAWCEIRWGSEKDSKLACSIRVDYPKDSKVPIVTIKKGDNGITINTYNEVND